MINQIRASIEKHIVKQNLHWWNYEKQTRKVIIDAKRIMKNEPKTEQDKTYKIVSKILYRYLFNTYEEILREPEYWDNFFNGLLEEKTILLAVDGNPVIKTEQDVTEKEGVE